MTEKKNGKATGTKVEKKTENGRQTVAKKPKAKEAGYKGHKPGSRKGEVHRIYDEKGLDDAMKFGLEQGLKPSTLKSWIGAWAREAKAA